MKFNAEASKEKILRRLYTKEFKESAAHLVESDGLGLTETAQCLSILPKTPGELGAREIDALFIFIFR